MLLQAIGGMLPAALAVALSPFPVVGIVLILAGKQGHRNGPLFAAGWVAGLSIAATVIVLVFGEAEDPDSTSSAIADWGRVLAGTGLKFSLSASSSSCSSAQAPSWEPLSSISWAVDARRRSWTASASS
ncbi:GAP family protein [Streptomyces sp. IBSBF 3136]|uniref:GAP family protein n=1 Tax=Streptomyces sp. IBSBF 3136 TaxID=2903524 RepID=UPI002FDC1AA0